MTEPSRARPRQGPVHLAAFSGICDISLSRLSGFGEKMLYLLLILHMKGRVFQGFLHVSRFTSLMPRLKYMETDNVPRVPRRWARVSAWQALQPGSPGGRCVVICSLLCVLEETQPGRHAARPRHQEF